MALPIWGIWMRKCLADEDTNLHESAVFQKPATELPNLDCTDQGVFLGGYGEDYSGEGQGSGNEEEYYFN